MNYPTDNNLLNFQSLIGDYECVIKEITGELDSVQVEHTTIEGKVKALIRENAELSAKLNKELAEKEAFQIEHQFDEKHLIENLKLQLKTALDEKEQVVKLWQSAAQNVDFLEAQVKAYQSNNEGFVLKSEHLKLKSSYEDKLKALEATVSKTKRQLQETISTTSRELKNREKEIVGSLQSHDSTFKIIKNLEEEVLKLQQRLDEVNKSKTELEQSNKIKSEEIENCRMKNRDCRLKVVEALEVVEAALNEKDAALARERQTKDELMEISKTLTEVVATADERTKIEIDNVKAEYNRKSDEYERKIKDIQEDLKMRDLELANYTKQCSLLQQEIETIQSRQILHDDGTSKLLALEKNLENTFQKLLLSEKQNIQLKADKESIKNDLEQMSLYYERDVQSINAEKTVLKNEVKKLKIELDHAMLKLSESHDTINKLKSKIAETNDNFQLQLEQASSAIQRIDMERKETDSVHNQLVSELQEQLSCQIEINKRWRSESKNIIDKLEKRIIELKNSVSKKKHENQSLTDKLRETRAKMNEHRKFLEIISKDVNKITNITFLDKEELKR